MREGGRRGEGEVTNTCNDLCRPKTTGTRPDGAMVGGDVLDEDAQVVWQIYEGEEEAVNQDGGETGHTLTSQPAHESQSAGVCGRLNAARGE